MVELGYGDVQVAPPQRWGTADEVDVRWAEQYHIELTDDVDGAAGYAVYLDAFLNQGFGAVIRRREDEFHLKVCRGFLDLSH